MGYRILGVTVCLASAALMITLSLEFYEWVKEAYIYFF